MKTPGSRRLPYVLTALLVLLVVIGLALLGTYLFLSRKPQVDLKWVNPLDLVNNAIVAPDLAVLPLAGYTDDRVINAALDASEFETAYTTLAYSALLPDNVRSGRWLLLASQYRASNPQKAAVAYQAALDHVALSPGLGDMARGDLALQVMRGYTALDMDAVARLAVAEAESIARFSVSLLPAQRRALLEQVAAGYAAIHDDQTAAAVRAKMENESAGPGIKIDPAPGMMDRLHGSIALPAPVVTAIADRQKAASDLVTRWLDADAEARAGLATALGQALVSEDLIRRQYYGGAEALDLADRLAMYHDEIAWLTIKYQAARGAYGVSLVSDWEKQAADIRTELASIYTELINGYGQQLDTLSASDQAFGRVELLRQAVLWSRLGLFPDHAESILSPKLADASRQLFTRQGGSGLVIVAQSVGDAQFYLLSGAAAAAP